MKLSALILSAVFAIFASIETAFAQDATGYKFGTSGTIKPEFDKGINFNSKDGNSADDQIQHAEIKAEQLFKASIEYPKKEFYATYNPGFNSYKNTLSGSRVYNYGGTSAQNLSLGFRYSTSLRELFFLDGTYQTASVQDFNDKNYTIKASTATLFTIAAGANLCRVYESSDHRLCPGVQLSLDSFPTLQFPQTSNTEISLKSVRDMTLGVNLLYMRPLFGNSVMNAKLAYDMGLKQGQASDLYTTKNNKISGLLSVDWPLRSVNLNAGASFEQRLASMQSAQDQWDIENLSYAAKLGARWEWGSK